MRPRLGFPSETRKTVSAASASAGSVSGIPRGSAPPSQNALSTASQMLVTPFATRPSMNLWAFFLSEPRLGVIVSRHRLYDSL